MSVSDSHILHLLLPPKDLYDPIISDDFSFYEKGYTKTYNLIPKYNDYYSVGIKIKGENFSSDFSFKGVVAVEFFTPNGKELDLEKIENIKALYKSEAEMFNFPMPFNGTHKNVIVKVSVLEPDLGFLEYGENIKLFIGVSGMK